MRGTTKYYIKCIHRGWKIKAQNLYFENPGYFQMNPKENYRCAEI